MTHRTLSRRDWPRGFGALNSSSHSCIFSSVSVGSSPRSYFFASATGRIGVPTAVKYGTEPVQQVTLYNDISAAQLRSVTEIAPPQPLFCVETVALSACLPLTRSFFLAPSTFKRVIFAPAQKLSSVVWT